MPESRTPSIEVAVFVGYLVAFMALLGAASLLFGFTPLVIVFEFFIVATMGLVAAADRLMR